MAETQLDVNRSMADPKPTIRVEGVCRGDGKCPVCGRPSDALAMRACGCKTCGSLACERLHLGVLLTEALRKLSDQRERADQAESARATQLAESIEVLQQAERERDAAIRESDAARDSVAMLNACVTGLTERAEKAEALLRECERFIAEHSTTWRSGRRLRDAMLARIREALPK